ncbi:MAG: zinc dependent phospholipase C family protein [Polyangia bacterium]
MAGTILHVTLAHHAALGEISTGRVRELARRHPDELSLGAVLVDLPYYRRLWLTALATALGGEPDYGGWGRRLHLRSPTGLSLALLELADDDAGRAIALGALTHQAVDAVFHREIAQRVAAESENGANPDSLHKVLEDRVDIDVHRCLLGHPGIGEPYSGRALSIRPCRGWIALSRAAILRVHGDAPSDVNLAAWLRWLRVFGLAVSTPLSPWVETTSKDDSEQNEASRALGRSALERCADYLHAGADYLAGELDVKDLRRRVPDRSMLDDGPADPPIR